MTPSIPLLAAAPLVAGLMGAALIGATPAQRPTQPTHQQPHVKPQVRQADVVEHVAARSSTDRRRVLDYWTRERMSDALPIDLLGSVTESVTKGEGLLSGVGGKTGIAAAPDLSGGKGKIAVPRRQAARSSSTTSGARWAAGGAVAKTTGRVFLTMDGVDFVCSASTVKSTNKDVVVTAGHCVKDGTGEWADNWTFVPGYQAGGGQPYGSFVARRMFVAGPWSRSGDDSYDVGMVALNQAGGKHVTDAVGAQNIAFGPARGGQAHGFGYPADPPYDGEHLVYCAGRLRQDPHGQTKDQGLACNMTAGSSGGPWLSGFSSATGRGTLTSVSSFKYSDDRGTMYGPYFGESAKSLFRTAERA